MKFRLWLTILSCTAIVFSSKALSQTQIATVASILDNPVEGQKVTLQGKIIAQEPGETDYIFTDGTNKITIELEEADFPYNPDTTVEISGVIDFESQHPEEVAKDPTPEKIQINVDRLQVVDANN